MQKLYIILFLCSFTLNVSSFASATSDTIRPVFTFAPLDLSVSCSDNVDSLFLLWFNNNASASLNDSTAIITTGLSNSQALDSLHASIMGCSESGSLDLGFFGIDSCNNVTLDTLISTFRVMDITAPIIIQPGQNKIVDCNENTLDSLVSWINQFANAIAIDNCSDTVDWVNLVWQDNQGNDGFINFGDPIDIPLTRDSCAWVLNVSFFVQDECGNINNTRANFRIAPDTIPPQIIFQPKDTIILCNQVLGIINPVFIDECDEDLSISFFESSSKGIDSLACDYYNYQIIRTWVAQDACSNSTQHIQNIEVTDTIPPTIVMDNILVKNCDEDISNIENLIAYQDACSDVFVNFSDSIIAMNVCQNQFIRTWELEDICGNQSHFTQLIQSQDFSAPRFIINPRDTMANCSDTDISTIFNSWLDTFAFSVVDDNCNFYKIFAREQKGLTDTLIIKNASYPELRLANCDVQNSSSLISSQEITFYAFDICGNISSASAFFEVTDTVPPVLTNCPGALEEILLLSECDKFVEFNLPNFTDSCLDSVNARWTIEVDQVSFDLNNQTSFSLNLDIGQHEIIYTLNDCANNSSSCVQNVSIRDTFPPALSCPDNFNVILPLDKCDIQITLPELEDFSDNCNGGNDFKSTLPGGNAFVQFVFRPSQNIYRAANFPVEFDNIVTQGRLFKPVLTFEYALNIDTASRVVIKSEFGDELFEITNSNCEPTTASINIEENQFYVWSIDNDIKFTVLFENGAGSGILPCHPENISGNPSTDKFSFIKITLQFSDIIPNFFIQDSNLDTISRNESVVVLSSGEYDLTYQASDMEGNFGTCKTSIDIVDLTPPTISCTDQIFVISPDSLSAISIDLEDLSIFAIDNCGIQDVSFFPATISCDDINKIIPVVVQAIDENQNFSSCTANLSVVGDKLYPTFISGLCFADSLKLFSNVDNPNQLSFNWTGPNNFNSNEPNPILTSINIQNAGTYNLEIVNALGCVFQGEINVEVTQFTSPQISSIELIYCVGEALLLNSNSFTENVSYFWYEGISPNGILVDETDGPSLELIPSLGQHFYYVEVKGEGCNSNPSSTIEINILPIPQATIDQPFVTICEGDDIALFTSTFQENFTYEWRGPNAYVSSEQFASVIENSSQANAGQYSLVVNNGACRSLPAFAEVIIFSPPPKPIIEGETIFCEGQSSVLTVSNIPNATRYHWYLNGVLFSSVSNNNLLIPSISTTQSGSWSVIVEDAICFSQPSAVFQIFVESSLNIGASNNGPVCEGDFVQLTSSFIPNATYQWQDPEGNFFTGREIRPLAVDGIYSVTVTTASNCTAVTSTQVEVGLRPVITALSNTSLQCMQAGSTVSLISTVFPLGNYQYQWAGPNGYESFQIQPTIQNIDQSDSGVYSLIVIQSNCASEVATTNLNFTIIPDAAILEGDNNLCEGEDLYLEVTNPIQGTQTRWIWNTPSGQIITQVPFLEIPNFSLNQVGNYSVIQELKSCRSPNSPPIIINLENKPPTPNISGTDIVCEGELISLAATTEPNAQYVWTTPNGEIIESDNTLVIGNSGVQNEGLYSVLIQKSNCISDISQEFKLEIIPKPQSVNFIDNEINLCADNSQNLTVCVHEPIAEYDMLILIDQATNTIIQESINACFDLSFLIGNISKSFNLNIGVLKDGCLSDLNDVLTINIFESPDDYAEIFDNEIILCDQEFITLQPDHIPEMISVRWSSPDPEINIFGMNQPNASFSNLRNGFNTIIVSSTFGNCANYAVDTVLLNVLSEINAENDFVVGEYNQPVFINPTLNDVYDSPIFIKSVENPKDGTSTINNNVVTLPIQNNLVGQYNVDYEICYIDCPDLCSTARITVLVGENLDCFAGNIITPNGDGYNDKFIIPCLDSGNYNDNSVTIINQWGDQIFKASPYLNNWEGTFQNKPLPSGTYFYVLELGLIAPPIQGFIVIEN